MATLFEPFALPKNKQCPKTFRRQHTNTSEGPRCVRSCWPAFDCETSNYWIKGQTNILFALKQLLLWLKWISI